MEESIKRVSLTAVGLSGHAPADGLLTIDLPDDVVAIDLLMQGVRLPTGNWGFRLADGSGVVTAGYAQGHARFTSSASSVSSASSWFPIGDHYNTTQIFYGSARFFLVDDPANRWAYSGEVWQTSNTSGEDRMFRPCGGTVTLSSPLESLRLWGNATDDFTAGSLSLVAWVRAT